MKSHWKIHRGVRIFYFDLSDLGSDDKSLIAETDAARAVILREPENSVLLLSDAQNTNPTLPAIQSLQLSAEKTNPYIAKAAVIGVAGSKLILLQLVNRFSKRPNIVFESFDEAADWLVRDQSPA